MPIDPAVDTTPAEALTAVREYFVELQEDREDFREWAAGEADGGPNADGLYPLRDFTGDVHLIPCPAKIAETAEATVLGKLSRIYLTYAQLVANPGGINGQIGMVAMSDTGKHVDPIRLEEVDNSGYYQWNDANDVWAYINGFADGASLPSFTGNGGKVLAIAQDETGIEWVVDDDGLDDAPADGKVYVRKNEAWEEFADEVIERYAMFVDERPQGTQSGNNAVGWKTRPLNTVKANMIAGAQLNADTITLPAGTYYIDVTGGTYNTQRNRMRLWNQTANALVMYGKTSYANPSTELVVKMEGFFTLAEPSTLRIDHYFSTASANFQFGVEVNQGPEIYTTVFVREVSGATMGSIASNYSIPMGFTATPVPNETLLLHVFAEAVTLPVNFAQAKGHVQVKPAANFTLLVQKNQVNVGTILFTPAGLITFTAAAPVAFLPGDVLQIVAPPVADTSIYNVAITLRGSR